MQQILFILFLFCSSNILSQSDIKGRVLDQQGVAIIGANVFIEGSYDGSVTNENGDFRFKTSEKGLQTLVISYLSYETFKKQPMCLLFRDLPSS
jgi:hypothetical protein